MKLAKVKTGGSRAKTKLASGKKMQRKMNGKSLIGSKSKSPSVKVKYERKDGTPVWKRLYNEHENILKKRKKSFIESIFGKR